MEFEAAGTNATLDENWIELDIRDRQLRSVDIYTAPHPGFTIGIQAQFTKLSAIINGVEVVAETRLENRFMHIQEL